jgi:hypothetical protein
LVTDVQLTYSEAHSRSAGQEISRRVWNPEVHFLLLNSPPLDPILSQLNPMHNSQPFLKSIHILFSQFDIFS